MLIMFFKHILFLSIYLRCLHTSLSGLGVDKILHLTIALVSSSSKKGFQVDVTNEAILLRMSSSMHQFWAVLKDKCNACQRLFISRHGWLLYLTALIAGNLCLLTQFMSSQGPCFLFEISWILRLKNWCFVFLTVLQNCFQFSKLFDDL